MIERKEYMALLDNPLQAIQDHYLKYLLCICKRKLKPKDFFRKRCGFRK